MIKSYAIAPPMQSSTFPAQTPLFCVESIR